MYSVARRSERCDRRIGEAAALGSFNDGELYWRLYQARLPHARAGSGGTLGGMQDSFGDKDTVEPATSPVGFQVGGRAWSPYRQDILNLLSTSRHGDTEPIYYGSNHTFLVTLESESDGASYAVYKPARGEYPLYDFPQGTLYRREIGSYLVDNLLGWNTVPATVTTEGKYGVGSLQLFIEAQVDGEVEIAVRELQHITLLDLILNNADRKGEHCLPGQDGKLWAIDHGLTFHPQPKLRTVLWHFSGQPIPTEEIDALEGLYITLDDCSEPEAVQLRDLLSSLEYRAFRNRVERLATSGVFPNPRYKAVPYRW
jgi:hypothetical protein